MGRETNRNLRRRRNQQTIKKQIRLAAKRQKKLSRKS
jgi:hypothetical protein